MVNALLAKGLQIQRIASPKEPAPVAQTGGWALPRDRGFLTSSGQIDPTPMANGSGPPDAMPRHGPSVDLTAVPAAACSAVGHRRAAATNHCFATAALTRRS